VKAGSSLVDIANRLSIIKTEQEDLLVKPVGLHMVEDGRHFALPEDPQQIHINPLPHHQVATHLKIPQQYYDRCREGAPELLAHNVNQWMQRTDKTRLLRTLNNGQGNRRLRGYLSDRYRPLDNYDLADAVLPVLESNGFQIRSCQLTETRFYVKAILEEVTRDIEVGDTVCIGVDISNSDVGCASLSVAPLTERLICKNGMRVNDMASRRRHVGRRNNGFDEDSLVTEFLTDETRQADDRAFWLKVRDTVAACATEAMLEQIVDQMQVAKGVPITGDAHEVVRVVSRKVGITESEESGVLNHLIRGGELNAFGLSNAITRHSQDVPDYDRATELEGVGWTVMRLPQHDFAVN